jgi:small subunit ribosomal protein S4e
MHLKRNNIPLFWPIPKKGKKYVAVPNHNQKESIPLVIVIRDILKLARNAKELKKIIFDKEILVNNKEVKDINFPVTFLDIITFLKLKKNYIVKLSPTKKIILLETNESRLKPYRVIGKKILKGNKVQLNLSFGRNIISNEKLNVNDTVIIDTKSGKIEKRFKPEKERKVFVSGGKYLGSEGVIEKIDKNDIVKIIINGKKVNSKIDNLLIIG